MVLLGIGIPGDGVIAVTTKSQDADHNWCPVCAGRLVRQKQHQMLASSTSVGGMRRVWQDRSLETLMHEQPQIFNGPQQRFLIEVGGTVNVHLFLHLDHAALGAKLREATAGLKASVDANQPVSPPVPLS